MNDDKIYRFISDPGHKENLSGRVRAACVNCRRKKTKCSGDVPCSTCEEKEIVCEGLTERKRPTKNAGRRSRASSTRRSSQEFGSEDGFAPSKRDSFDSSSTRMDQYDESSTRPTARLQKLATNVSEDSGYASGTPPRQENAKSLALQLETHFPFSYSFGPPTNSSSNDTPAVSPSRNRQQDWNLAGQLELTGLTQNENRSPGLSQRTMANSGARSGNSLEWPSAGNHSKFWVDQDANTQTTTTDKLLNAATALEQQAMSLRRLAGQEPTDDTRRQTIMFPIYNQYNTPTDSPDQLLSGSYDDMSPTFDERSSRTRFTPPAADFDAWLSVHPELSSSFGYHAPTTTDQHNVTVPGVQHVLPAETGWPSAAASYNTLPSSKSAKISEHRADARQAAPRYHSPSQNAYAQLYPWPE